MPSARPRPRRPAFDAATRPSAGSGSTALLAMSLAIRHARAAARLSIVGKGYAAFVADRRSPLDVALDPAVIDPDGKRDPAALRRPPTMPSSIARRALRPVPRRKQPAATSATLDGCSSAPAADRELRKHGAGGSRADRQDASGDAARCRRGRHAASKGHIERGGGEADRQLDDKQIAWFDALAAKGLRCRPASTPTFFSPATAASPSWPASGARWSARS